MKGRGSRPFLLIAGIATLVVLALLFPGALAFAELAARELRYFWWLVALLGLGIWIAFFLGRDRKR